MKSDFNLPAAGRSWDEAEFDAVFRAYYDDIYRMLFRIVGTRPEAEDLAQETFLRLFRRRFSESREHNLRAWLYRVATNLAYNSLRSTRRREGRQETATYQMSGSGGQDSDPASIALRNDERETVRCVLASLRPRQAQLLLLRHAGLSYREIAQVLNVASGSVGTLLARAEAAFEAAYRTMVLSRQMGGEHEM